MYRDTAAPLPVLRTTSVASLLLCGLALGWTGKAWALGLGPPQMQTALGQALQLEFPLSLSAGESLSSDCVSAEVVAGTSRLPAAAVRVQLQGSSETSVRAIRVLSKVKIEEPIVSVTLSLGCPARLTRQYSALLDPPRAHGVAASSSMLELPQQAEPPRYTPALRAALATTGAKPHELLARAETEVSAAEQVSASQVQAPKSAASRSPSDPAKAKSKRPQTAATQTDAKPQLITPAVVAEVQAKVGSRERFGNAPKLRLEPLGSVVSAAAEAQVAASAAQADAAMQRLQNLEAGLGKLREEKRASELRLQEMRSRLEAQGSDAALQADSGVAAMWPWALLAVLGAGGGIGAWLWKRGQSPSKRSAAHWWDVAGLGRVDPAASHRPRQGSAGLDQSNATSLSAASSELTIAPQQLATSSATSAPASVVEGGASRRAEPPHRDEERTISLAKLSEADPMLDFAHPGPTVPGALSELPEVSRHDFSTGAAEAEPHFNKGGAQWGQESVSAEPLSVQFLDLAFFAQPGAALVKAGGPGAQPSKGLVSVESLIDLEQQTDFFVVLGQEDAAVDLLQECINGQIESALPYLKLMEICQKRGEALAFADLAGRYSLRFDAIAPSWDQDLSQGRDLEAYPEVLRELQELWTDSAASMILLQRLLSNRGLRGTHLDLPALRDLLLLYSVARDRSEHEEPGQEIDLFLPLESDLSSQTGFGLAAEKLARKPSLGEPTAPQAVDVDIVLDDWAASRT